MVSAEDIATKWIHNPEFKSAEEEFAAAGTVSFYLPAGFMVGFGKRVLHLEHTDRWSTFLINETARHRFLTACNDVACLAGAGEMLFLPEGTVVMDQFYSGAGLDEVKRRASRDWGPPDLDISQMYTKDQVNRMSRQRVHYFLVNVVRR